MFNSTCLKKLLFCRFDTMHERPQRVPRRGPRSELRAGEGVSALSLRRAVESGTPLRLLPRRRISARSRPTGWSGGFTARHQGQRADGSGQQRCEQQQQRAQLQRNARQQRSQRRAAAHRAQCAKADAHRLGQLFSRWRQSASPGHLRACTIIMHSAALARACFACTARSSSACAPAWVAATHGMHMPSQSAQREPRARSASRAVCAGTRGLV